MTEDDTALREVDIALAEDKQAADIQKNLPALIGGAVLIVVSVGGWQLWERQKTAAATENAIEFREATSALAAGDDKAVAAFEEIADGAGGYAVLAKLRLAGVHTGKGERDEALALLREVYAMSAAPKRLKDLARIRAGYISISDSRADLIKDVGPLEADETPLGFYGRELLALAAFQDGDYQTAEEMFRTAASSVGAPEPVRQRAEEFAALASAGKAGVEFGKVERSNKSDVDRFIESLEQAGGNLGSVLESAAPGEHDGHDHGGEESVPDGAGTDETGANGAGTGDDAAAPQTGPDDAGADQGNE
ncbi:MAG: tetratricopeptide repeat protein [Parvularculaceae bacterium]